MPPRSSPRRLNQGQNSRITRQPLHNGNHQRRQGLQRRRYRPRPRRQVFH